MTPTKAPRHWIEHTPDWRTEPMAYWVHLEQGPESWHAAESFDPPAPAPEGRKGFRVLCVEIADVVLRFSSAAQLSECIRVLALKPLPTSRRLSAIRGTGAGPNGHWLSRLPARIKSPKARAQVVRQLRSLVGRVAI
jgi:hypothetical protein